MQKLIDFCRSDESVPRTRDKAGVIDEERERESFLEVNSEIWNEGLGKLRGDFRCGHGLRVVLCREKV